MALRFGLMLVLVLGITASRCGAAPAGVGEAASDRLPPGAIARFGDPRLRPDAEPLAASFAPDGRSLWVATRAPAVEVWDIGTGYRTRRIAVRHPEGKWAPEALKLASLTPDCKVLVLGDDKGVLYVIDPTTGVVRCVLRGELERSTWRTLSLATDGKRLAAADDKVVSVWDTIDRKIIRKINKQDFGNQAELTPDGQRVVLSHKEGNAQLVDAATGRGLRRLQTTTIAGRKPPHAFLLMVSEDGRAFFYTAPGDLIITSLESGKVVGRIAHFPYDGGVALSPDGRHLAVDSRDGVQLFGLASGQTVERLETGPRVYPWQLRFSQDGRLLAAVGQDGIRLWDLVAGRRMHPGLGHSSTIWQLLFLQGGKYLATGGVREVLIWDATTARLVNDYPSWQVPGDRLWKARDGKGVHAESTADILHTWGVEDDATVMHLEQDQVTQEHENISPDGRWQWTRPAPGNLMLIRRGDTERNGRLLAGTDVVASGFSPDGRRLLAIRQNWSISVWACASGHAFSTLNLGEKRWLPYVRWRSDGRSVLIWDEQLRLLEVFSGQLRHVFPGDTDPATPVVFSPDGRLIARGDEDGSINIWDADSRELIVHWQADHGGVWSLAFSPDGRLLGSGGTNGTALLWKVPERKKAAGVLTAADGARLWEQLASLDPKEGGVAIAALTDAPDIAVELIGTRLKKAWQRPRRQRLEHLISDLDADTFAVRQKANRELQAAGHAAEGLLRKALERSPSPEKERQLRRLLGRLEPAAVTPERLQAVRAIEVLERIGRPQARDGLRELYRLADDPVLREEIDDSLQRLQNPPPPAKKEGWLIR
jgi:WD40 repeat protein